MTDRTGDRSETGEASAELARARSRAWPDGKASWETNRVQLLVLAGIVSLVTIVAAAVAVLLQPIDLTEVEDRLAPIEEQIRIGNGTSITDGEAVEAWALGAAAALRELDPDDVPGSGSTALSIEHLAGQMPARPAHQVLQECLIHLVALANSVRARYARVDPKVYEDHLEREKP